MAKPRKQYKSEEEIMNSNLTESGKASALRKFRAYENEESMREALVALKGTMECLDNRLKVLEGKIK